MRYSPYIVSSRIIHSIYKQEYVCIIMGVRMLLLATSLLHMRSAGGCGPGRCRAGRTGGGL